jgi:hypothetical protein
MLSHLIVHTTSLCTPPVPTCPLQYVKLLTWYGGRGAVHQMAQSSLFVNLLIFIWGATSELVQLTKYNHVLTKGKPTVTPFPNMQSVASHYHTIHHLTHTAVTRLASYWTARLRYLLLTVFSFKSLSVHKHSYHHRLLNVRRVLKLRAYCVLQETNNMYWLYHSFILRIGSYMFRQ